MAINMMNDSDYIKCKKCNGMVFEEKETFTLKKTNTNTGIKLAKQIVSKLYLCTKCGDSVTQQVKKFEVM